MGHSWNGTHLKMGYTWKWDTVKNEKYSKTGYTRKYSVPLTQIGLNFHELSFSLNMWNWDFWSKKCTKSKPFLLNNLFIYIDNR